MKSKKKYQLLLYETFKGSPMEKVIAWFSTQNKDYVISDIAYNCGVSRTTVRNLISKGILLPVRMNKKQWYYEPKKVV